MVSHRSAYRNRHASKRPFIAFLLVASFGILFAGCSGPQDAADDSFVFTEQDIARYRELAGEADSGTGSLGTGSTIPYLESFGTESGSIKDGAVQLDLSLVPAYTSMRQASAGTTNRFQVTNEFLNVRASMSTNAATVRRLSYGDPIDVVEFMDGMWAKVTIPGGGEGYVAHKYISRVTSEDRLAEEERQYDNMYFVSFAFVNMRKEPDQKSEKIGEIPGRAIVRPLSIASDWAKVKHDGKEGYVSLSYLTKLKPNFIVRQDGYVLPVLHYRLGQDRQDETLAALRAHVNALKAEGYVFITMKDFYDLLLAQQRRDAALGQKRVIVALSGITSGNVRTVSDTLNALVIDATLFIASKDVGVSGITEKSLLTLQANGFDIQSATHTGDDLRALTNAQADLELKQSRRLLEEMSGKTVFAVAYPEGGANDRIGQIAADAGYLLGLTDGAKREFKRADFLRLPGLAVFPSTSVEEVKRFVTGS